MAQLSAWRGTTTTAGEALWFTNLVAKVNAAPEVIGRVALTAQTGAIAATAVDLPRPLVAGRFRVSYYARITQAAPVSSSLIVTVTWTDGGVVCSKTFTALTGNTVDTTGSGDFVLQADDASSITYSTAYVSS